jgi:hypothetical protein
VAAVVIADDLGIVTEPVKDMVDLNVPGVVIQAKSMQEDGGARSV